MRESSNVGYTPLEEPIPITEHKWPEGTKPLVTTRTMAYEEEDYVRACIEGILMQKTTFPVQVMIHDDASTDKTAEIILEYECLYPLLITAYYQSTNSHTSPKKAELIGPFISKIAGKYIALCEGDDYWTDPLKLQKQVEFLEANPECGLVHTELDHYYVTKHKLVRNYWKVNGVTNQSGDLYEDLLLGNKSMIYLCTTMYRRSALIGFDRSNFNKDIFGDVLLTLYIASQSKIGYLDESTAVRRVRPCSVTQGKSFEYWMSKFMAFMSLYEDFNAIRAFRPGVREKFYQKEYRHIVDLCFNYPGQKNNFKKYYRNLHPREIEYRFKNLMVSLGLPHVISMKAMVVFMKLKRFLRGLVSHMEK